MAKIMERFITVLLISLYVKPIQAIEPSSLPPSGFNRSIQKTQASVMDANLQQKNAALQNSATSLALAQSETSQGRYKKAKTIYIDYLSKNPKDKAVLLRYITVELWDGNYPTAELALARYKTQFGEDTGYLTEKARLLALTHKSQEALAILDPLLKKTPKNYTLLDIKNYILTHPTQASTAQPVSEVKNPTHALLELAATQVKKSQYKAAAKTYQTYLHQYPEDKAATLAYIQTQLWQNHYALGEQLLANYQKKFGVDENYSTEKARLLALSNQSKAALQLISTLLKKYPGNAVLPQIKDYALKHPELAKSAPKPTLKTAQTLECKAKARANAALYAAASQAYAVINQPQAALRTINAAIRLAPRHIDYLKTRADIANQLNQPAVALDSYCRILMIKPHDSDAMLGVARSYTAENKLRKAADTYADYLDIYPKNKTAWIEYVYTRDWAGDSRSALAILKNYFCLFGKTQEYLMTKARVLAEASRPTPALCMVNRLLKQNPNDIELIHTKLVALYYNNQPIEAFANLAKLRKLTKNNAETQGLSDFVTTPYRTNANLDLFYSKDTDSVEINHATLSGQIFITPLIQVLLTAKEETLAAAIRSGLTPINGGTGLTISEETIGMNRQITPKIDLEAALGNAHATYGRNAFVYHAFANLNPTDTLSINLLESRNFYDVSARAVSLGVKQQLNQVLINWEPSLARYLILQSSYSTFTDSNTMWLTNFAAKMGVARNEILNLDVGINGEWFGFSQKLNHGYYDPKFYQFYSLTANGYIKQSSNVGYGFSLGIGEQKDETFVTYKFGGDVGIKGYFGIYKDWMLVLSAGISNRGRGIANQATNSTYEVWGLDATITRRF